jgi:hypothetical protein
MFRKNSADFLRFTRLYTPEDSTFHSHIVLAIISTTTPNAITTRTINYIVIAIVSYIFFSVVAAVFLAKFVCTYDRFKVNINYTV